MSFPRFRCPGCQRLLGTGHTTVWHFYCQGCCEEYLPKIYRDKVSPEKWGDNPEPIPVPEDPPPPPPNPCRHPNSFVAGRAGQSRILRRYVCPDCDAEWLDDCD